MGISSLSKLSSGLATIVAGIGILTLGTSAHAGSGATGSNIIYGSGSYGSYSSYGDHKYGYAHKHKHDKRSYYITSIGGTSATTSGITHSTRADHRGLANYSGLTRYSGVSSGYGSLPACPVGSSRDADGLCMSTRTGSYTTGSYTNVAHTSVPRRATSYSSRTHSASALPHRVVPFTTTVDNIANYKAPGMGANEFLSKTSCPTNVYNPEGGQVLGCYSVVKPVPVVRHQVHYQHIQVVRPVIYVRYPVPTPIAIPVPMVRPVMSPCASPMRYSRYGDAWPRMGGGCGGW